MKNTFYLISAVFMIIAASCSKSNDAGNDTGISLSFKGTTTFPTIKKSSVIESYIFTEALMGIKEIEIKKEDEEFDDEEIRYDFEGSYLVDLLSGTSNPPLGFTEFTPGTYDKFESKTAPLLDGGKSLSLKGTYTDSEGTPYKFEFSTESEIEFEIESESGFILNEGIIFDMLVNINLPLLFEGVDFSKATVNLNGIIVINDSSNSALSEIIISNIDDAAEMEDEDESDDESEND